MKKIILGIISALMVLTLVSAPVLAYTDPICSDSSLSSEQKSAAGCGETATIWDKVQTILNIVIAVAGIVCIIVIIICAIQMSTSAGNAAKTASAIKGITFAIVGVLVCILSWAIINFVLKNIF